MTNFIARHGDLLIQQVDKLPEGLKPRQGGILVHGTATGHSHYLIGGQVMESEDGTIYMQVAQPGAKVVHEEHATIMVPIGDFVIIRQRQFDPYEKVATEVLD